jgi:hypothetical protein
MRGKLTAAAGRAGGVEKRQQQIAKLEEKEAKASLACPRLD